MRFEIKIIKLGSLKIFIQRIKYDIKHVKHIYNLLKSKSECIYGPFSIKFFSESHICTLHSFLL